ncbi:hypothetical protein [Lactobacillus gallinarum]|uniref:hypothetical protein n=1 Tax=Lactobacillus gallinarum TaxID=52242 RepID=UPI0024BA805D|nr:hypothetical protein [Lactobacillus gallinarum]
MTKKTVNLVMAVANDGGNGFAKTYTQFENGTSSTTITPSLYTPISSQDNIPAELDNTNWGGLDNNMDVVIKSSTLKTTSELLVGTAAINSGNTVTYNVESNIGKVDPDITLIIPLVKTAYAALNHILAREKSIPNTINVNLSYYLTCLPISEYSNKKKREILHKKLTKGKHTVLIKNFSHDVKVNISLNTDNTYIYPEGITAQIGLIYSADNFPSFRNDDIYTNSPYKDGQDYSKAGNTLLIDIGDGTTDISIINATHPLKGMGVNISLNQGTGTAAAAASDQLQIDYPQLGHYTRSVFLEHAARNNKEGQILRIKYLSPQIELLIKAIETEIEKEYRKANNDINTVVVLGGGTNLLTNQERKAFQRMLDSLNPLTDHQQIWWIDSRYNQLLNLDGLRVFLARKIGKNR